MSAAMEALFVEQYETAGCNALALNGLAEDAPPSGWYVYMLIDPADGSIFYVGKGSGGRMRVHERQARRGGDRSHPKVARIEAIMAAGRRPVCRVYATFDEESEALRCERALIAALRAHGLANIQGGTITVPERMQSHAKRMLADLMPLDDWLRAMTNERREQIRRVFGMSPTDLYQRIRSELAAQADTPAPNTLVAANGRGSLQWR